MDPMLIYWYKIMMLQTLLRMQLMSLAGLVVDLECKVCGMRGEHGKVVIQYMGQRKHFPSCY